MQRKVHSQGSTQTTRLGVECTNHEVTAPPPNITMTALNTAHLQFPAHHSSVGCIQQGLKEAKREKNKNDIK